MKLNEKKFSLAATITMGLAYIICVVFTVFFPEAALRFLGWMAHLVDVKKFTGEIEITFGSFVLGLLPILFYTYITTYFFAWLYNKLESRS